MQNRLRGILLLRVAIGLLLVAHGLDKLLNFENYARRFPSIGNLSPQTCLLLTILSQLPCGLLIAAGIRTRYACLPPLLVLTVAILLVHLPRGMVDGELALLYVTCLIVLAMVNE